MRFSFTAEQEEFRATLRRALEARSPTKEVRRLMATEAGFGVTETYLAFAPAGFTSFRQAIPLWLREKLFQRSLLGDELRKLDPACIGPAFFSQQPQKRAIATAHIQN